MNRTLIKICGVRTPEMAAFAADAGADCVGIIFHPASKRAVALDQAVLIAHAAREHGAEPVAVFVDQTAQDMRDICDATHISMVQLHGERAAQQHRYLADHYQRLYVRPVSPSGQLMPDDSQGLQYCDPHRDYVLFDNVQAGKGECFDWQLFQYSGAFRMCFSGGLHAKNVGLAIQSFQPDIVDVCSGVEHPDGYQDQTLIKQFINAVRCAAGVLHDH